MKQSEMLFAVIKSLSATEKKHFRTFSNRRAGDKKYFRLFEAISEMDVYDEKQLRQKLRGEKFLSQLPVAKNYLSSILFRSLRQLAEPKSIDSRIAAEIKNIELLYSKSLFPVAMRKIDPVYRLAAEHEKFGRMLEIIGLKKKLVRIGGYKDIQPSAFQQLLEEEKEVFALMENLRDYEMLNDRYFMLIAHGARKNEIEALLRHKLFQKPSSALSYKARIFYHLTKARMLHSLGKTKESAGESQQHIQLLESLPQHIFETERYNYIVAVYNQLIVLTQLKRDREFSSLIRRLRKLQVKSEKEKLTIFYTYATEIDHELMMRRYHDAVKLEQPVREGLKKYAGSMNRQIEAGMSFNLSCAFLFAGKFRDSLRWINRIVNDPKPAVRHDIHLAARILSVFTHSEIGNNDLIPRLCSEALRYAEKNNVNAPAEKMLIDEAEDLLSVAFSKTEKKKAYAGLLRLLNNFLRKNPDTELIYDYRSWLKFRCEN